MAKRFVFKLQPVLRQRESEELGRQLAVAALERERLDVERAIRAGQRRIEHTKRDLRSHLAGGAGGVDMTGVRLQANASLHMAANAQRRAIELAGVYKRLASARAELVEATTRRKAMEVLRERRYERWLEDATRAEAAEADELAVMRAHRRGDEP